MDKTIREQSDGGSAPMTSRLASAAHEAINEAAVRAAPLETQIRTKAVVNATEQVEHSLDQLQSFVKERPLTAAGIAFAAGMIATVLLRR